MKKVLFSSAAALACAVGLSSFSNSEKTFQTHYYWQIASGKATQTQFLNSDLTTYYGTTNPGASACAGTETIRCVIGFTVNQVEKVGGVTVLKTNAGATLQTRVVTADKRPSA